MGLDKSESFLDVQEYLNSIDNKMLDVDYIVSQLTEDEKCRLLAAEDWWHTIKIPRLDVPAIRFSDGPNGVRGQRHFNSTKTTCFPAATGLAATWNKELLFQVGELLSEECKLKGARLLLGPTVNMARSPLGGRAFESFSEDPVLSGLLASEYINGVQKHGVACALKHLVCNDQELERNSQDSILNPRTLREVYLLPFQLAIKNSKPLSIMTSYNKVNGVHCSEDKDLLQGIVRDEWGFEGLILSDWLGTYSVAESIKAGLDLECPGPSMYRHKMLASAIASKKVDIWEVDERCKAVLKLINDTQSSGIGEYQEEKTRDFEQDKPFLRNLVAEGVVLLKNEKAELPLAQKKKTAVIGFNAAYAAYAGGGSSLCRPYYKVSPLESIQEKLGKENVFYEAGAYSFKFLPSLGNSLKLPNGNTGATLKVYNYPPDFKGDRDLVDELIMDDIGYFRMNDYFNDKLHSRSKFYVDIESTFIPEFTGEYLLGIAVHGTAKLFIDGELIIDNATNQKHGTAFYGQGASEVRSSFNVVAGKKYSYHIEFGAADTSSLVHEGPPIGGGGGLICGGILNIDPQQAIDRAVNLAKQCEQVIVVTGLNKEWESEGADRVNMSLPPHNDELIQSVLKAKPDAVIVVQSGSPVDMSSWVDDCRNLLHISYGGNENGNGLADVIFGDVNPSGRLPLTIPRRLEDNPSYINFGAQRGKVYYGEGVYIGYRYYEKVKRSVLFPFGYGLSYTSFEYNDLQVKHVDEVGENFIEVSVKVKNTGNIDGSEVVQVYVSQIDSTVQRPIKELKDFDKKFIKSGATETLTCKIPLKYATSFWDEERHSWISEKGEYEVLVGGSSDAEFLTQKFQTGSTFFWKGL
ncbi:putative probable beta-glucosidase K [[Candida] jaroonii]|uniref:Probable beta-glucosidase K n=1 Tax=[Candida] jaroonii TaxID=467808 RepID=A0ACA9YEL2_9ASCO|nr:putative probable beta-glucosidase K [[Candida] jaroonii]